MKNTLFILGIVFCVKIGAAQDFMLQGWYWDYPKTCDGYNWADTLKAKANAGLLNNFSHVWLPPMSRASFGNCSNGYDPQDLYDLGEYGGGPTGFGTRTDVNDLIGAFNTHGIDAVADVVYNHRDGGAPESNSAVKDYITTYYTANKNPFPSDRFRCVLPIGGSSGNGAGDYYFKISSKTQDPKFYNKAYKVYIETSLVGWQSQPDIAESEPNGGGDCSQGNNAIELGRNMVASIDASGCRTDEFHLQLDASDFNPAGDNLIIYLTNPNGDYSDHRIYGLWRHNSSGSPADGDISGQIDYQTYTDFTNLPSGQGGANFESLKPNSTNAPTTYLAGDWDWLWFFYDYDQDAASTRTLLFDWTRWLWNDVGIRGFRMDAVKHFPYNFTGDLLDNLHSNSINPGLVVGEFYDSDPFVLKSWVDNTKANMNAGTQTAIQVRVFDFALRQALKNACDSYGYDARNVFNSGVVDGAGGAGFDVITFINNHDFRDPGQPVQNDPMLAYAYILTNNQVGLPCVFYPEYFGKTVPNYPNVNLRNKINDLIQFHSAYIYGANKRDYLNRIGTGYYSNYSSGYANTTLFYQLAGGPAGEDVLVAINFAGEPLTVEHQINADLDANGINMPVNTQFIELTSNSTTPMLTVNNQYRVSLSVPARSYAVWVQSASLPVELVDFQANAKGNHIELIWKAASESGFSGYDIERSGDGRDFDYLAIIAPKGTASEGSTNYAFQDYTAAKGKTWYYRLKLKDEDGTFTYTQVRSAILELDWKGPQIVPNPTEGNLQVIFDSPSEGAATMRVLDSLGRQFSVRELSLSAGKNMVNLDENNIPLGVYFILLEANGEVKWRERGVRH